MSLKLHDNAISMDGLAAMVYECVSETIDELRDYVRGLFPGSRFMSGWDPSVMVVSSMPGQHDFCTLFLDFTVECEEGAERSNRTNMPDMPFVQHWTTNTAFSRQEFAVYGTKKMERLIRHRTQRVIKRFAVTFIGASDQVYLDDDDSPSWLREDEIEPDVTIGTRIG